MYIYINILQVYVNKKGFEVCNNIYFWILNLKYEKYLLLQWVFFSISLFIYASGRKQRICL